MPRHASGRRSAIAWLKDDLRRGIHPRILGRLVRREPRLLIRWLVELGVGLSAVAVVLLLIGRIELFSFGVIFIGAFAGTSFAHHARAVLAKNPDV